jgi:bidirectional [NiFe] hydrogenase diaphorase subunit
MKRLYIRPELFIGCGACAVVCPTGAVKIEDRDGQRVLRTWNTTVPLKPCRSHTTRQQLDSNGGA